MSIMRRLGSAILSLGTVCWLGVAEAATLSQGTFWDFRWDSAVTSSSSSGTSTSRDGGMYRLTLGPPTTIQGRTAYPITVAGRAPEPLAWSHLVPDELGYLGSEDGSTLVTLFDPTRASWSGGGFFENFADFERVGDVTWGIGAIDNDYVSGQAAETHASANKPLCEIIAGTRICGEESYSHDWYEYWSDTYGPTGSKHDFASTFSGGGFFSAHDGSRDVGVTASSLFGDRINFGVEIEPNELASPPMPLPPYPDTIGFTNEFEDSDEIGLQLPTGSVPVEVHDWYSFQLSSAGQVSVDLTWDSRSGTSDLDLILYQFRGFPLGNIVVAYSIDDNLQSGVESETLQAFLSSAPFGSYAIGVSAFDTTGVVEYELHVVPEPSHAALGTGALAALVLCTRVRHRGAWRATRTGRHERSARPAAPSAS